MDTQLQLKNSNYYCFIEQVRNKKDFKFKITHVEWVERESSRFGGFNRQLSKSVMTLAAFADTWKVMKANGWKIID